MNNLSDYKYPEFNEDFEGMIPQSGGGGDGGGGVSAVTLYADVGGDLPMLYKDEEFTQGFATADEAIAFIEDNPVMRIKYSDPVTGEGYIYPTSYAWGADGDVGEYVVYAATGSAQLYLFVGEAPEPDPGDGPK